MSPRRSNTYNLKFHGLSIKFDGPDFLRMYVNIVLWSLASWGARLATYKVNTDSRDVAFRVGVIGKTKQKARLSNTGVPDEEKLEEIVVSISVR